MADRVILAFIILLAVVYFYATSQIPSLEIGDPLGPKAFPYLIGIALLATGGMLFIEIVRAQRNKDAKVESAPPFDMAQVKVVGVATLWTLAYFFVFEWLGYAIASALYLIPLMAYFNRGKWVTNILSAVLFSGGSYVLFTYVLGVTLARGILPY